MNYHTCPVCKHEDRIDIESALLAGASILGVTDMYPNLKPAEVKRHMVNCAPYVTSLDEFDKEVTNELNRRRQDDPTNEHITENYLRLAQAPQKSIQRQLSLREADHLSASIQEYLLTLKNLGRKINRVVNIIDTPEGAALSARVLRKPVCDMYVQMGAEIRSSVETMAKLDNLLNGPADNTNTLTGLSALAAAINSSAAANQPANANTNTLASDEPSPGYTDSETNAGEAALSHCGATELRQLAPTGADRVGD